MIKQPLQVVSHLALIVCFRSEGQRCVFANQAHIFDSNHPVPVKNGNLMECGVRTTKKIDHGFTIDGNLKERSPVGEYLDNSIFQSSASFVDWLPVGLVNRELTPFRESQCR